MLYQEKSGSHALLLYVHMYRVQRSVPDEFVGHKRTIDTSLTFQANLQTCPNHRNLRKTGSRIKTVESKNEWGGRAQVMSTTKQYKLAMEIFGGKIQFMIIYFYFYASR
jgi:hypothetical protein